MANDVTRYNDRNTRRDLSLFDDFFDSMLGSSRLRCLDSRKMM